MRLIPILVCAMVLAGCAHPKSSIRLAVVDRGQLQIVTSDWARKRFEDEIAKETLTPEVKQQLDKYNQLQADLRRLEGDLIRRRMDSMRGGPPPFAPPMMDPRADPGYTKLSEALSEVRRPIADLIDRRSRRQSELQYPIMELIEEYAKDRFDLVLDRPSLEHSVLYRRAPEVTDITQGVIDLFRRKEK